MFISSLTDVQQGCVVFDLDGVLVDNSERLHRYLDQCAEDHVEPDWSYWHTTLPHDDSKPEYVALARLFRESGIGVIILTARVEEARGVTTEWLERHLPFGYDLLEMRDPSCDFHQCKRESILDIMEVWDVRLALDDQLHWVNMYRELGIPAIHVVNGHDTIWEPTRATAMMREGEKILFGSS